MVLIYTLGSAATDWIYALGTGVYALATTVLAIAAVLGVVSWKRQLLGKTDYDLARKLLMNIFQLRDRLQMVRSPWMSGSEYAARPGRDDKDSQCSAKDNGYAYQNRWAKTQDIARELELNLFEARAIWGDLLELAAKEFFTCQNELFFAVESFIRDSYDKASIRRGDASDAAREEKQFKILYSGHQPDEYADKLNSKVKAFEDLLRPKLK